MSVRDGLVAGVRARIFRVSFAGELSFEVNVDANYGRRVWEAVMEAGREFDVTPYGTEAMHVLRAEKGYVIVGQDTDGSNTPDDMGVGGMVSKRKDFLGRRSLTRQDMLREGRKQLVGLLTGRWGDAARRRTDRSGAVVRNPGPDAGTRHVELLQRQPGPHHRARGSEGGSSAAGRDRVRAVGGRT